MGHEFPIRAQKQRLKLHLRMCTPLPGAANPITTHKDGTCGTNLVIKYQCFRFLVRNGPGCCMPIQFPLVEDTRTIDPASRLLASVLGSFPSALQLKSKHAKCDATVLPLNITVKRERQRECVCVIITTTLGSPMPNRTCEDKILSLFHSPFSILYYLFTLSLSLCLPPASVQFLSPRPSAWMPPPGYC